MSSREKAQRAIATVQTAEIGADEPLLLAQTRAHHRLKMPDACVLATAMHFRALLATFDTKLASVARDLGLLHT